MAELSLEKQIELAIKDVGDAMLENMQADKAEFQAKDRKTKAHYNLQQANQRLWGLQQDTYNWSLESIINKEVEQK
jgi:hypothetical protein